MNNIVIILLYLTLTFYTGFVLTPSGTCSVDSQAAASEDDDADTLLN